MLNKSSAQGAIYPVEVPPKAVPAFGNKAAAVRLVKFLLDAARNGERQSLTGTALWVVAASSLSAAASVSLQDQHQDGIPVGQGFYMRGVRFDHIYLTNTAQPGEWIQILVAVEDSDKLEIINPLSQAASVKVTKSSTINTSADVACANGVATQVLPADATRRTALIRIPASAAASVRAGDSNTGAARGVEVQPGEQITIESTGAIYIYNGSGGAISVSVTTTND